MVPAVVGAPVSLATASDYQWSWDFPNFMSSLGEITGVTNQNMTFTRAEFDKLNRLSALYEPADLDSSRFAAHGGKLVMWQRMGRFLARDAPLGSLELLRCGATHDGRGGGEGDGGALPHAASASIIAAAVRPQRAQTTCRNSSHGGRTRFPRGRLACKFRSERDGSHPDQNDHGRAARAEQ